VVILVVLASAQLISIFWHTQQLHQSAFYVARAGALNHGSMTTMTNSLVALMAGMEPPSLTAVTEQERPDWALHHTKSWLKTRWHFTKYGRLQITSPTQADWERESEWRIDPDSLQWVREIAIDHSEARQLAAPDRVAWSQARLLTIKVDWCLPLVIPFVDKLFAEAQSLLQQQNRFCQLRQVLSQRPLWSLQTDISVPLGSGFRQ